MSRAKLSCAISIATGVLLFTTANLPDLHAQAVSSASVTGRVMDEQGAIVPNARVQISGVNTGVVYTAISNADGIYTVPNLPIGAYRLEASTPGFQTYVQTGILLRVGDNVQINL